MLDVFRYASHQTDPIILIIPLAATDPRENSEEQEPSRGRRLDGSLKTASFRLTLELPSGRLIFFSFSVGVVRMRLFRFELTCDSIFVLPN